jgi:hypothetical protein
MGDKPIIARPIENPDFKAILAKIIAQYPKTLAYLARH